MAIGPVSPLTSDLQQVYQLSGRVADRTQGIVRETQSQTNSDEFTVSVDSNSQQQGLLPSETHLESLIKKLNAFNIESANSGNTDTIAPSGTNQENSEQPTGIGSLLASEESFIEDFDELSDNLEQLKENLLFVDNEFEIEEQQTTLEEIFDEIPEDQVEKFFEQFSEFDQIEPEANTEQTLNGQEDRGQSQSEGESEIAPQVEEKQFSSETQEKRQFDQLQKQFETFQKLETPEFKAEVEVAKV